MPGIRSVHDAIANKNETLEHHAEILASSAHRRMVFEEIYRGRGKPKTAKAISSATGLTQKAVLTAGLALVGANMAVRDEVIENGRKVIAYGKEGFCRDHRDKILRLVDNPQRLAKLPTKRKQGVVQQDIINICFPKKSFDVNLITIDDIQSFCKVHGVVSQSSRLEGMSENTFKNGIRSIVGEQAQFKDWGGETSDLMTTRVVFGNSRCPAAFAFKGPGQRGRLTVARMGKNGDQCQRLFRERADIFLVQHWREIDPSVIELMHTFAIAKSVTEMRRIHYGVVDGQDSCRLVKAYPEIFKK